MVFFIVPSFLENEGTMKELLKTLKSTIEQMIDLSSAQIFYQIIFDLLNKTKIACFYNCAEK